MPARPAAGNPAKHFFCFCWVLAQMLDMLRLQQNALHGDKMEIIIIALIVVRGPAV
jgi:hypothetical protein